MLDITKPPADLVRDIASCGCLLSSALHGLICADSLGIPNQHMILSDRVVGGEYKFLDYYSVFENVRYDPIRMDQREAVTDDDIRNVTRDYAIAPREIDAICDRLMEAFPVIRPEARR